MDEVEVDREAVERCEARLAVGPDRLRAAVRDPGAAGARHAALRHDPRARVRAAGAERSRQKPLVVSELALVAPYARAVSNTVMPACGRGRDRREGELLVAVLVRGQAHAAEPDAELRRVKPVRSTQEDGGYAARPEWSSYSYWQCRYRPRERRSTCRRSRDLVVIYLGNARRGAARLRDARPRLGPGRSRRPVPGGARGLLLHESITYSAEPLHVGMRQYWRDLDSLEAWARERPHKTWWTELSPRPRGHLVLHETYFRRGGFETTYVDVVDPVGLKRIAPSETRRRAPPLRSAAARGRPSGRRPAEARRSRTARGALRLGGPQCVRQRSTGLDSVPRLRGVSHLSAFGSQFSLVIARCLDASPGSIASRDRARGVGGGDVPGECAQPRPRSPQWRLGPPLDHSAIYLTMPRPPAVREPCSREPALVVSPVPPSLRDRFKLDSIDALDRIAVAFEPRSTGSASSAHQSSARSEPVRMALLPPTAFLRGSAGSSRAGGPTPCRGVRLPRVFHDPSCPRRR